MKNKMELVDEICAGMSILDYFDDAIIGYDVDTKKVIYDYNLMLKVLTENHKIEVDDAIDYLSYNVIGLKIKNDDGDDITPIIISKFEDELNDKL